MLEILIFSDSHGNVDPMRRVIAQHPSASHILFCGDGIRDLAPLEAALPKKIFLGVKGNCDFFVRDDSFPVDRRIELLGLRILLLHGHTVGVKEGYGLAASRAYESDADIVIFGHTHLPYEGRMQVKDRTVHLFNPGSIGKRFYNGTFSYGLLTVGESGYLFSHGNCI